MKQLSSDIAQESSEDCDSWKKGNTWGKCHNFFGFLPEGTLWSTAPKMQPKEIWSIQSGCPSVDSVHLDRGHRLFVFHDLDTLEEPWLFILLRVPQFGGIWCFPLSRWGVCIWGRSATPAILFPPPIRRTWHRCVFPLANRLFGQSCVCHGSPLQISVFLFVLAVIS